jgi:heme a synthase
MSSLYDLEPLGQLLLLAAALALIPLFWYWAKHRHQPPATRLRALTLITLFLTFDLVLFGAFTRLSDSGLGCPDWPGCYGSASPLGARDEIHEAQTALPTGPVTFKKAWIEMIHRYAATVVGALITVLMVMSWWHARRPKNGVTWPVSPWWATLTFVWVCLQGAFGALTVTMKLYPAIVTLHLLGGLGLLVLLTWQAEQYGRVVIPSDTSNTAPHPHPLPEGEGVIDHPQLFNQPLNGPLSLWERVGVRAKDQAHRLESASHALGKYRLQGSGLRHLITLVFVLCVMQITLGGWVSTNYAVLACTDFPTCQGQWWPPMDWAHGFQVLRPLGVTRAGGGLPFEALTAIHMVHRLGAVVWSAAVLVLVWRLWRLGADQHRRWAWVLIGLLFWQVLSGVSNVVLGWPLLAALAHTGGAAAWVIVLTTMSARARSFSIERRV